MRNCDTAVAPRACATCSFSLVFRCFPPLTPDSVFRFCHGVREPRAFYDACDEFGILIYHDAQFANGGLEGFGIAGPGARGSPSERAELEYQVKRLSHHPSIAMFDACNVRRPHSSTSFCLNVLRPCTLLIWAGCRAGVRRRGAVLELRHADHRFGRQQPADLALVPSTRMAVWSRPALVPAERAAAGDRQQPRRLTEGPAVAVPTGVPIAPRSKQSLQEDMACRWFSSHRITVLMPAVLCQSRRRGTALTRRSWCSGPWPTERSHQPCQLFRQARPRKAGSDQVRPCLKPFPHTVPGLCCVLSFVDIPSDLALPSVHLLSWRFQSSAPWRGPRSSR